MKIIRLRLGAATNRAVRAHVFGQWAAHRSVAAANPGCWDVTHVPTGLRIYSQTGPLDRREALAIARRLGRASAEIARDPDGKHIVDALVAEALS